MDMRDVYSSSVDKIGYDAATGTLTVLWSRSGKTSAYSGVPSELADQTMRSASIGQALREAIQGVYPHKYI